MINALDIVAEVASQFDVLVLANAWEDDFAQAPIARPELARVIVQQMNSAHKRWEYRAEQQGGAYRIQRRMR